MQQVTLQEYSVKAPVTGVVLAANAALGSHVSSWERNAGLAGVLAMLGGCAVGPNFVRPAPTDTDRYTESRPESTIVADGQAQQFKTGAVIAAEWCGLFKSAELDAVVRQAIAHNPTLQASEASLRQSQDAMRAGCGVFFPQVQADVAGSRQPSTTLQQGTQAPGRTFSLITASGTVSYALAGKRSTRKTWRGPKAANPYYDGDAAPGKVAASRHWHGFPTVIG